MDPGQGSTVQYMDGWAGGWIIHPSYPYFLFLCDFCISVIEYSIIKKYLKMKGLYYFFLLFLCVCLCCSYINVSKLKNKSLYNHKFNFKMNMSQKEIQLESWSQKNNIETNGIKLSSFGDNKLRGMAAYELLNPQSCIISVPSSAVLEVVNNRPPTEFPDFVPQSIWEASKWDMRLAFKLLYEWKILGVNNSDKYDWIMSLPSSFSTPLHWTKDIIKSTQYKPLETKINEQKTLWKSLYQKWQDAGAIDSSKIEYNDFVWALECVNSRAFSGVYEGSTSEERQRLLIFTGILTLVWPLAGFGSWEQSLNAAIAVGVSILLRDFFFSKGAQLKRYVVCPVVDMFNHKSTSTAEASFNYFSGKFEVLTGAKERYQEGDQVYITYGKQGNDRLLQYYGFVESNNLYDSYDFGGSFLEVFLRLGDDLEQRLKDGFPSTPSPQDRLVALTRLLEESNVAEGTLEASPSVSNNNDNKAIDTTVRFFSTTGWDDVTVRCMRAMVATSEEWTQICGGNGRYLDMKNLGTPLSEATEKIGMEALAALAQCELDSYESTLNEDLICLKSLHDGGSNLTNMSKNRKKKENTSVGFGKERAESTTTTATTAATASSIVATPSGSFEDMKYTAIAFRVEKKKLLHKAGGL